MDHYLNLEVQLVPAAQTEKRGGTIPCHNRKRNCRQEKETLCFQEEFGRRAKFAASTRKKWRLIPLSKSISIQHLTAIQEDSQNRRGNVFLVQA